MGMSRLTGAAVPMSIPGMVDGGGAAGFEDGGIAMPSCSATDFGAVAAGGGTARLAVELFVFLAAGFFLAGIGMVMPGMVMDCAAN